MTFNKKPSSIFFIAGFLLLTITSFLFALPSKEENGTILAQNNSATVTKTVPDSAEQIYFSFSAVAKKVLPIVVEINTVEVVEQRFPSFNNPFEFFFKNQPSPDNGKEQKQEFKRPGLGSGVIVKQDGKTVYVLTNNHVIENANEINVRLNTGEEFEAEIIGNDTRTDLSLIKFESTEKLPVATLGDSDALEVGDIVLAIGTPFGFESTVTMGIVSALARESLAGSQIATFTDYIQTDASINPGNSGGALVNMKGEIIGINTWITSQSGGSVGLGFAIPINIAKNAITDFITKGKVDYGWLGVSISDINDSPEGLGAALGISDKKGALVLNIFKKSPADKSGLLPGDFITKIDGVDITNSSQLTKIVGKLHSGTTASFVVIRNKKEVSVKVKIESRADESEIEKNSDLWPGIVVTNITDEIRKELKIESSVKGVVIAGVIPNSSASSAGFKMGDIIEEINETKITNVSSFYSILNKSGSNRKWIKLNRGGVTQEIGFAK